MHKTTTIKRSLIKIILGIALFPWLLPGCVKHREDYASIIDKRKIKMILSQAVSLQGKINSQAEKDAALVKISEAYAQTGDPNKAELLAERISQPRLKTTSFIRIAIAYAQTGDKDSARRLLQQVKETDPKLAFAAYLNAVMKSRDGDPYLSSFLELAAPLFDEQLLEGKSKEGLALAFAVERIMSLVKEGDLREALSSARREFRSLTKERNDPLGAVIKAQVFVEISEEALRIKQMQVAREALEEARISAESLQPEYRRKTGAPKQPAEDISREIADAKIILLSRTARGFGLAGKGDEAKRIIDEYIEKAVSSAFSRPSIVALAYASSSLRQAGLIAKADELDNDIYSALKGFIQEVDKLSESKEDALVAAKQAAIFAAILKPYLKAHALPQVNHILAEAVFSPSKLFKENLYAMLAAMYVELGERKEALAAALNTDTVYYRTFALIKIANSYAHTRPDAARKILDSAYTIAAKRSLSPLETSVIFCEVAVTLDAVGSSKGLK
jgi:hypothetical protein